MNNIARALLAGLVASAALALPLAAGAQAPSYAEQPSYASHDEQIQGRVVSFDGGYNLQVHDKRGFIDNVRLHQGTVINPTGLTLRPGMAVTIIGTSGGNVFNANVIDTPYTYAYAYGPYPYPYYYPPVAIGIGFGWGGGWGRHWR
ncbi:MAG TPA: hypothetical protein VMD91_14190 [Candidatus Sulfotelmatobacter sp.]|nr:hypothetical protein [Candidatus Sulfotelmatobacter sp.]